MFTRRLDLDHVLHDLTMIGFGALLAWSLTGLVGTVSGYLTIQPEPTLRFLLSIIVLVFARHTLWRLRQLRWGAHGDPSGLAAPVWETPRVGERAPHGDGGVTESPQPQG
jgi:hypothetical protein